MQDPREPCTLHLSGPVLRRVTRQGWLVTLAHQSAMPSADRCHLRQHPSLSPRLPVFTLMRKRFYSQLRIHKRKVEDANGGADHLLQHRLIAGAINHVRNEQHQVSGTSQDTALRILSKVAQA